MKDIDDLIELIMGDPKLRESKTLGEKVYRDEPILKRASQLVRDIVPPKDDTPAQLMEMRRMAYSPEAQWRSREWLFGKQGSFMADFEDDFEKEVPFEHYFPTYNDMTLEQQRTYFTWRTSIRRGEYRETSLSYIFVYIYELINLIGVKNPREGYDRLKTLLEHYGETQPKLKRFVSAWLDDMVIYYGLDIALLKNSGIFEFDDALCVLLDTDSHTDDEVFSALCVMSSYSAEKSAFYKAYPEDFRAVAVRSYKAFSEYYGAHRKKTLFEKFFGKSTISVHQMFNSAVFCYYRSSPQDSVVIDDVRRCFCRGGEWFTEGYAGKPHSNKEVGKFLRAVDSLMRRNYDFKKQLQTTDITKQLSKIITEQTDILLEEKKRAEAMRVDIDLSKLGSIRRAADITREKLIVDEEEFDEDILPQSDVQEDVPDERVQENTTPLDSGEYAFMQALLYGGDCQSAARNAGSMPSILADSINEKLYDIFADTVIEFDGDTPAVIEDYEEELKGMILP
ncbi:MAG: TerB N-terminal domain-containing protein [Ruminococcus sp.]|uniref:TerB N-terminal domain-containing protein n=1 Tax=Ruminococcus sp. TaxID=41978 RepID=UPI0025DDFA88|nr:TerB N-terminal domain-containing protein [Ruminococcus sp.]MBO4867367.1 TerB N-terminal domain-containing protein [Ruminococcus sp.]